MSGGRKVEFLVAGVQKGGTTALFDYLREQPGLQLPVVKEAHFFDDEQSVDWAAPDYEPYHRLFSDDGRMWGEATPIYIYWPNALERIAAYNPAMRFVLLFRDPVERAWSHWKMEYAKGKEREPFAWCIREGRARLDPGDPVARGHHRVFSYVERGYYGTQVKHLLNLFPREQCLFLRSDALRDSPATTMPLVCDFLGQPLPPPPSPRIVHASPEGVYGTTPTAQDIALLSDTYATELADFSDLTGVDVADWLVRGATAQDAGRARRAAD